MTDSANIEYWRMRESREREAAAAAVDLAIADIHRVLADGYADKIRNSRGEQIVAISSGLATQQ